MNPFFLKGLSNWILVIGCIFTLLGTIGSLYFGRRVGKIEPYLKPIRSANSTVELILKSNHINDVEAIHHVDQGAVIGFFKDEQELLVMYSIGSFSYPKGKGSVVYRAVMDLDPAMVQYPVTFLGLRETDKITIILVAMPKKSDVLGGKATCIFNGEIQINIDIPAQKLEKNEIIITDLNEILNVPQYYGKTKRGINANTKVDNRP